MSEDSFKFQMKHIPIIKKILYRKMSSIETGDLCEKKGEKISILIYMEIFSASVLLSPKFPC